MAGWQSVSKGDNSPKFALCQETIHMPEQSPADRSPPHIAAPTPPLNWWSVIGATKGSLWVAFIAVFYLCGFLVLNAHLAKFGISEFEMVGGRYLLAGANFAFFLVCYYLFAGRAVMHVQRWLSEDLQLINEATRSAPWSLVVFLHSFVRLTFFCCLSAAIFTSVALWQIETRWFYGFLAVAFIISYTVDVTNLDIRFRRANELLQIAIELGAIYAFFSSPNSPNLIGVFGIYAGITVYINLVLDNFQRRKVDLDRVQFAVVHSLLVLLTTALGFGATYFGQIASKLGGGRPQEVTIAISHEAKGALPRSVLVDGERSVRGRSVYQTERYMFLEIQGQTVRFRGDDIALMVVKLEEQEPSKKPSEHTSHKAPNP